MTKAKSNPILMRSNTRLFTGLFVASLAMVSIVVILAFFPNQLFAIFPMPTLIIGISMVILELRNRIELHRPIVHPIETNDETQLLDSTPSS